MRRPVRAWLGLGAVFFCWMKLDPELLEWPQMFAISLQSGSNGNCIYVEAAGKRLLFDAGISGLQAERRLARHGIDIRRIDAVIISHDHSDHIRCAGVYQRKFHLPLYATAATLDGAKARLNLGKLTDVRHFRAGEPFCIGDVHIMPVHTPHDATDGVALVITDGRSRLGILTDLGHVFDGLADVIACLDAAIIESNYDVTMLAEGPYPLHLQQRIRGPHGHLSNEECARLLATAGRGLKWACLAHLSEENNTPEIAMATHGEIVSGKVPLRLASRYDVGEKMEI